MCGAAAALSIPPELAEVVRLILAWFAVVPIFGSVWVPVLGSGAKIGRPRLTGSGADSVRARAWFRHISSLGSEGASINTALALVLGLTIGYLLAPSVSLLLLVAVLAVFGFVAATGRAPSTVGWLRSMLEILVPALVAWLSLGGNTPVAASMAVSAAPFAEATSWLGANWLFPGICLGFLLVHDGATAVSGRATLARGRWLMVSGYALVITLLALAGSPLSAGLVALLFVAQWPFQAAFQSGYVKWHWRSVRLIAFAAMFVASLGAR
jgi:hypothetical protein